MKKKGTKTKWELVGHRIVLKVTAIFFEVKPNKQFTYLQLTN